MTCLSKPIYAINGPSRKALKKELRHMKRDIWIFYRYWQLIGKYDYTSLDDHLKDATIKRDKLNERAMKLEELLAEKLDE